jgi:hypothetical protein
VSDLSSVEEQFGFVFGDDKSGESAKASPVATVSCTNPVCDNRNHHITVHEDTVQPVLCGQCGQVLHCDHDTTTETVVTTGTLAAPMRSVTVTCDACGKIVSAELTPLPPIRLEDLPIEALNLLVNPT